MLGCHLSMVSGWLALQSRHHGGMAFWHADDLLTVPAAVLTQTATAHRRRRRAVAVWLISAVSGPGLPCNGKITSSWQLFLAGFFFLHGFKN